MKFIIPLFVFFITLTSLDASAHERREVVGGEYRLTVGWRVEPAFEDVSNAVDIFVVRLPSGEPVSVRDGDDLDLNVSLLYLDDEEFGADILASRDMGNGISQDFSNPSRYNLAVTPTRDGAYGILVEGTIEGNVVSELYVCGNGSLSATSSYDCIEDPEVFPDRLRDRYRDNRAPRQR